MKYSYNYIWLLLINSLIIGMNKQHGSPAEKKQPSPQDHQIACKPICTYLCMVRSLNQRSCHREFDNLGDLKVHLRSMHALPLQHIEKYYIKK